MKTIIVFALGLVLGVGVGFAWCGRYEFKTGGPYNMTQVKCDRWTGRTYSRTMMPGRKWELDGGSSLGSTIPEPAQNSEGREN